MLPRAGLFVRTRRCVSIRYEFGRNKTRVSHAWTKHFCAGSEICQKRNKRNGCEPGEKGWKARQKRVSLVRWGRVAWCVVCVAGPPAWMGLACYRTGSGVGLLRAGARGATKIARCVIYHILGIFSGWRVKYAETDNMKNFIFNLAFQKTKCLLFGLSRELKRHYELLELNLKTYNLLFWSKIIFSIIWKESKHVFQIFQNCNFV